MHVSKTPWNHDSLTFTLKQAGRPRDMLSLTILILILRLRLRLLHLLHLLLLFISQTPSSLLPQHVTEFTMTSLSLKIHADLLALGPATHLLLTTLFYTTFLYNHTLSSVPRYNAHLNPPLHRHISNAILTLHILASLFEAFRLRLRALTSPAPLDIIPDSWDLLACLLQCATNLYLVRRLDRGVPRMTRPAYQAGALVRAVLGAGAWWCGSAAWHASSVRAVDAFLYTRGVIAVGGFLQKRGWGVGEDARMRYK